ERLYKGFKTPVPNFLIHSIELNFTVILIYFFKNFCRILITKVFTSGIFILEAMRENTPIPTKADIDNSINKVIKFGLPKT
ncbi:MAG: hypothetical protein ACKOPK_21805, partial [Dolichospermum sp.]